MLSLVRSRAEGVDIQSGLCISFVLVGHYTIILLVEYVNIEVDFPCHFCPSGAHLTKAVYCTILCSAFS